MDTFSGAITVLGVLSSRGYYTAIGGSVLISDFLVKAVWPGEIQ